MKITREQFNEASARQFRVHLEASAAFAAVREVSEVFRNLRERRQELESRWRAFRDSPAMRASRSAVHRHLCESIEDLEQEIAEVGMHMEIAQETINASSERAQRIGRQRDETAKVIDGLRSELVTLERAARATEGAEANA